MQKSMASFDTAVKIVLRLEGGYQDNPADWGNYSAYDANGAFVPYNERRGRTNLAGTNRGISANLLSSIEKRAVTVEEMKSISESRAKSIYKAVYWDRILGDQIKDQKMANLIFDAHVLHGSTGIRLVQQAINQVSRPAISVDGTFGPVTLSRVNGLNQKRLYDAIIKHRIALVKSLAESRPGNEVFLNGWLNRIQKFIDNGVSVSMGSIAIVAAIAITVFSLSE